MAVPQEALWMALAKLGVPDETVQLIKCRTQSQGSVWAGSQLEWAQRRMQQGSWSPLLFNLLLHLSSCGESEMASKSRR